MCSGSARPLARAPDKLEEFKLRTSPHSPFSWSFSDSAQNDYVTLGLSESSNGKPSGLADDQWRDIWWSLWALTDADAAIADYQTVDSDYVVEAGETKAHTYHWLHAFRALGHLKTGTGTLTSDHPAALAFEKAGTTTYVVYNFTNAPQTVSYSDGHAMTAAPLGFTITSSK